ncbi:MAG: hypothetical protein R2695_13175 [Acidimicrobiales bacterium]
MVTTRDPARQAALEAAADRLVVAAAAGVPCPPVRELVADAGLDEGYAVQEIVRARTEQRRTRAGRKIGLTSEAVQQQMGVATPDLGVLHTDMAFPDGTTIPSGLLLQPRIEAEVAFVLGADLPAVGVTAADVAAATDHVVAAIEVCDSRIAGWDISLFDTVADNAPSGVFVLGGTPGPRRGRRSCGSGMTVVCEGWRSGQHRAAFAWATRSTRWCGWRRGRRARRLTPRRRDRPVGQPRAAGPGPCRLPPTRRPSPGSARCAVFAPDPAAS